MEFIRRIVIGIVLLAGFAGLAACGVKSPPLPPLAVTPEQADARPQPSPTGSAP